MRSQRRPSSTDWPGSNGTSKLSQRPASRAAPRQIFSVAIVAHEPSPSAGAPEICNSPPREPYALMHLPVRQHVCGKSSR